MAKLEKAELFYRGSPVQTVAQIDEAFNRNLKDVMGVPVEIEGGEYTQSNGNGRFAITQNGLICIKNVGMNWDNDIEGVHVNSITTISTDWGEITRLTGWTKEGITQVFDQFEKEQKVGKSKPQAVDQARQDHYDMMDRAGDFR